MAPHKIDSEISNPESKVDFQGLESLLQRCLDDESLQVVACEATKLLPPGENYCSIMVKLDVKIHRGKIAKEETLHLVAKTPSPTEKSVLKWSLVFKKEVFMYAELRSLYRELERDAGIEEDKLINVWPEYFGYRNSLNDSGEVDSDSVMLMDNIKTKGFYNADRKKGLDVYHAKKAIASLARYHALGIVMKQKRPTFAKKAEDQALVLGLNFTHMDEGYDSILKTILNIPCLQRYQDVIKSSFKFAKNGKIFTAMPTEPWATITHGDFWVNNILFHKDNDGNVDDVKFVDFQMYLYSSPLKDLPYFFNGSLDKITQTDHINELIDLYYNTFVETLRRMNCDISLFTRESFDCELKKQAIGQLPLCALVAKFFVAEVEDDGKQGTEIVDNIIDSEASDAFISKLMGIYEMYERLGWFS